VKGPLPGPVKDWEKTLKASLKERWKRYRRALKRCQRKFSEKAVHASRIETRRLLSLVELLNIFLGQSHLKKTRRALKRHLDAFDSLRDTQVQLLLLEKHRRQFPEARSFHQMLVKREGRCLKAAARRIKRVNIDLLQKVFYRLARQLDHMREGPSQRIRHRAAMMNAVRDAFAKAVELQRAMDPGAAETIHRTRIAFKKFRYMVEALQPLFAEITRERVSAMQDFQSMMGEVQDGEVFFARLDKHTRGDETRAKMLARFRHWLLVRHTAQITYCLKHADRLHEFWPLKEGIIDKPSIAKRAPRSKFPR
jgi:CHAD domain-containing protein